ncbi:MAG: DUF4397 domain-containing protein [Bryobacteraceae bacterium]
MRLVAIGTSVSLGLLLCACSPQTTAPSVTTTSEGQITDAPAGKDAAEANTALVRFVNADPSGATLQLWAGDRPAFPNVAYKGISPYMQLPRGYTQFKLRVVDGKEDLASSRRELFPGRHYTFVALPPSKKGVAKLVSLSDNLGAIDPGEARIRLINATQDVDDLDLYKEGTNMRIAHGVDAGATTSFTDLAPGSIEVHQGNQPTPMKLSMLPVGADRLYTFIVVGTKDKLDAVQIVDQIEH